ARRREAAVAAGLGGAGFFLAVDSFLLPKVGPFALPLALVVGVCWVPWGLVAWPLLRGPVSTVRALAALVLVPSAWVAGEFVRAWPALGGPWGLLGAAQWNQPAVLALASVGGVWAGGFLLVAVNVGVTVALVSLVGAVGGPGGAAPTRARAAGGRGGW